MPSRRFSQKDLTQGLLSSEEQNPLEFCRINAHFNSNPPGTAPLPKQLSEAGRSILGEILKITPLVATAKNPNMPKNISVQTEPGVHFFSAPSPSTTTCLGLVAGTEDSNSTNFLLAGFHPCLMPGLSLISCTVSVHYNRNFIALNAKNTNNVLMLSL